MRRFTGGNGQDTTAAALAFIAQRSQLFQADLVLIGEADDPLAVWLTTWEAPLLWSCWGTFLTSVLKRGDVSSKIGLDSDAVDLTWSPKNTVLTTSLATASYYQLARLGWFDGKRVRIWRTVMPTPGDANTYGAYELFGGIVGDVETARGSIKMTVNSFTYALDQKVPSGVIEATDTVASYVGFTPPPGFGSIPQFNTVVGSTENVLLCDQTSPSPGGRPDHDTLDDGAVVFNGGPNATLQGSYAIIGRNDTFYDGNGVAHVRLYLNGPLPWAPTPGVDTFFITGAAAVTAGTSGFPYVPSPETAV